MMNVSKKHLINDTNAASFYLIEIVTETFKRLSRKQINNESIS